MKCQETQQGAKKAPYFENFEACRENVLPAKGSYHLGQKRLNFWYNGVERVRFFGTAGAGNIWV